MKKKELPEYRAWKAMKSRCYSPSTSTMGNYRKFSITVCEEWINDFNVFYRDMGPRPSKKHSLDRIDTKKNYSKDNCRWVEVDVQIKNRGSFTPIYTLNGESHILKDWSKKLNIKYTTLRKRIISGMPFEKAIKNDPYSKLIRIGGQKKNLKEWCVIYDRKYQTVINRIHDGWEKEKAILTETKCKFNEGE